MFNHVIVEFFSESIQILLSLHILFYKMSESNLISRGIAPINNIEQQQLFGEIEGVKLYNTSYAPGTKYELHYNDQGDYGIERERALNNNTKDGVKTMTKEEQDQERSLSYALLKKFTMKIVSMDFTRFSFPVGYSEPRSFLERTTDLFSFLSTVFIDKALNTSVDETRLVYIAMGVVSGFQLYMQSKKPWNPVLGETYVGEWPNGVKIFGEQISHHPPISAFQIIGKNWKCRAQTHCSISAGIREVDILQIGTFYLELQTDSGETVEYEWVFPNIGVFGILRGDRLVRVLGPLLVKDNTHDLSFRIDIYPKNDKNKGISDTRASLIYGGVFSTSRYTNPDGSINVSQIQYDTIVTGDYCDKVTSNGEVVFDIRTDIAQRPNNTSDDSMLLPSDSRFRLDRALLIQNRVDDSDEVKIMIEEMQRREEKMRILV